MKLVSQEGAEAANDHGLDGMVKVIARRCRNDTGQAARIGPERIALGNHVANEHTAGQRHQEVDGNGTQSGRPQIDIGRRKGRALDVSTNAFRRDDGNIAGHVETPKSRIYKEQADANQPRVLLSDISNDAAGAEFSDPGTENNQHTERATAGNGVDDAGGVGIVITQQLDHPAGSVPAPGRVNNPGDRANHNRDDPKRPRANALNHRARYNRSHGPGKQ